jgi:peroxiredoxin Q/BCP
MMIEQGAKAPDFCLNGIDGEGNEKEYCLSDLLREDREVVLYFYPKDNTPGCTQEACDFRDNLNRITGKAVIVGVSRDSIASHRNFREKHGLTFPLLSDPDHKVLDAYGAWGEKKMYGKTTMGVKRSTCLIGADGKVKKLWVDVKVNGHVDEVLKALG